jgi:hypothetical protein
MCKYHNVSTCTTILCDKVIKINTVAIKPNAISPSERFKELGADLDSVYTAMTPIATRWQSVGTVYLIQDFKTGVHHTLQAVLIPSVSMCQVQRLDRGTKMYIWRLLERDMTVYKIMYI